MTKLLHFFSLTFIFVYVNGQNCDKEGILIYEDLGCTAHYDNNTCPVKYSCLGLEPSGKNCYYRGKSYEDRESVSSDVPTPPCQDGCFCSANNESSSFACPVYDCPEWQQLPLSPGCYFKDSLHECCSVGTVCPPYDNIAKCVVDGNEYKEGQSFSPLNASCLSCICQKGFKGKYEEPFCRRTPCGDQLFHGFSQPIQASCAPFYKVNSPGDDLCCPHHWICPDGSEKIEGEIKSDDICKFGNKTLKVGQYFKVRKVEDNYGTSFDNVTCQCAIPPLARCVV